MKRITMALSALVLFLVPAQAAVLFIPIPIPSPTVPLATKADYARIHKVAIISAIGHGLDVEKAIFLHPLGNNLNIDGWKIDDAATGLLKEYLSPRFQFVDLAYDGRALAAIHNGRLNNSSKELAGFLGSIPADGVDAFLVIRPDVENQAPPEAREGISFYLDGDDAAPELWADYEIDIVDAKTLKQIAKAFSRVRIRDNTPESFAGLVTSKALTPDKDLHFTDSQMTGLENTTRYLLRTSMVETLRALDLGVDLPAAGARILTPIPPESDPYRTVKSAAVVSLLGDQLQEDNVNVFLGASTEHSTFPISNWRLDEMVETRVKNLLSQRFTFVNSELDRTALTDVNLLGSDNKLRSDLPVSKSADDVDLYILILNIPLPIAEYKKTAGPGLYKFTSFHSSSSVYVHYLILLVDGHTLKIRATALPKTSPDRGVSTPWKLEDVSLWPDQPPMLSPEQEAKVKGDITDMLNNSLDETLLSLGLTGQMEDVASLPPPEANTPQSPADAPNRP